MDEKMPDTDLAIVGGGIGGIYSGWRLLSDPLPQDSQPALWAAQRGGPRPRVMLFEGSDRIGGRLLSARSPHFPDTTAEIGGMRYVAPAQRLVTALVEDVLKLPWHEQVVDQASNIAFLRGKLLRSSALNTPAGLPYFLNSTEAAWLAARSGQSPASLIGRVLTRLMPGIEAHLTDGTLRQYLMQVKIDPSAPAPDLWQLGFWNLLAQGMSPDGYAAARATIGYDCLGGNYNARDLTAEYFDFTPGVSYRMVDTGYETVPWTLQKSFEAQGGEIRLNQWLTGFDSIMLANGSQGVCLQFRGQPAITARAILLAMPRRSIELLRPEGAVLTNAHFREDLASVAPVPLFKLFLLYNECWWQEAGVTQGRSLTDMPLRQCYYWPIGSKGIGVPARNGAGLLMAYDDLLNVGFWAGLDTRPHAAAVATAVQDHAAWSLFQRRPASLAALENDDPFARRLQQNWQDHSATAQMVREMHRQLTIMHGVDSAPQPIDAAYMDWSRDPYGGGVHLWNPNYDSAALLRRMTKPVDGIPCYLCGEAYSTNQTWAEGALQTAEIVLRERLGLAKAGWQHD